MGMGKKLESGAPASGVTPRDWVVRFYPALNYGFAGFWAFQYHGQSKLGVIGCIMD
jgi:hypothetical protein